jgi:hypothetical protein
MQQAGMQSLAWECLDRGLQRFGQPVRLGPEGLAIVGIADERMADMGHVHADLVGAAGFQPAFDQACRGEFPGPRRTAPAR